MGSIKCPLKYAGLFYKRQEGSNIFTMSNANLIVNGFRKVTVILAKNLEKDNVLLWATDLLQFRVSQMAAHKVDQMVNSAMIKVEWTAHRNKQFAIWTT